MFFIAGMGSRMKDLGAANGDCPACGGNGLLHVAKESQSVTVFFIPVAAFGARYYVTCGQCASVMELCKDGGKRLENDSETKLHPHELKMMKNNNKSKCPDCGRQIYDDQRFCPGCGKRI